MDEPWANIDSQNSPWPELGGSHHLPPYTIICASPWSLHPNVILSWCRNPNLGFATKARACKRARQEGDPRGTSYTSGSVGECESQRTPKSLRNDCRGQTHWFEEFFISLERYQNINV